MMNAAVTHASSRDKKTLRFSAGTTSAMTLVLKNHKQPIRLDQNQRTGKQTREGSPDNECPHRVGHALEEGT